MLSTVQEPPTDLATRISDFSGQQHVDGGIRYRLEHQVARQQVGGDFHPSPCDCWSGGLIAELMNSPRLSVLSAITSTQQKLKLFNRVPDNGLCVFVGTVLNEEGKEKKISFALTPFKPINT
jgi:hypothetical protein